MRRGAPANLEFMPLPGRGFTTFGTSRSHHCKVTVIFKNNCSVASRKNAIDNTTAFFNILRALGYKHR